MDLPVEWHQLDEGDGIASTLANHCAMWHKYCRDGHNKTKLGRVLKRKIPADIPGQISKKRTRSSIFPDGEKGPVCFFCEESADEGDLREALTKDIDSRVRSVAHEISDFNLISKLSTGSDMIALGAKYHARCLAALYNCAREHSKELSSEKKSQVMVHSEALADLISKIENSRTGQPHATVFKLSDLKRGVLQKTNPTWCDGGNTRDSLHSS